MKPEYLSLRAGRGAVPRISPVSCSRLKSAMVSDESMMGCAPSAPGGMAAADCTVGVPRPPPPPSSSLIDRIVCLWSSSSSPASVAATLLPPSAPRRPVKPTTPSLPSVKLELRVSPLGYCRSRSGPSFDGLRTLEWLAVIGDGRMASSCCDCASAVARSLPMVTLGGGAAEKMDGVRTAGTRDVPAAARRAGPADERVAALGAAWRTGDGRAASACMSASPTDSPARLGRTLLASSSTEGAPRAVGNAAGGCTKTLPTSPLSSSSSSSISGGSGTRPLAVRARALARMPR